MTCIKKPRSRTDKANDINDNKNNKKCDMHETHWVPIGPGK